MVTESINWMAGGKNRKRWLGRSLNGGISV
jgi:hypothetical protein